MSAHKPNTFPPPSIILLDIEGTICPISFVKDVLFPYALNALPHVCNTKWHDAEFKEYIAAVPAEFQSTPETLIAHVQDLTERDVKIAYLKNLQGYLWKEGYQSGAFASPLFPDVTPRLRHWHERGLKLAIYSSGSVAAQKLLLQFAAQTTTVAAQGGSRVGGQRAEDLRPLFEGFFDTVNAGLKTQRESYVKIGQAMGLERGEFGRVAFFSDNVKETQAALEAGMTPVVVVREGNAPLSEEEWRTWGESVVESFDQVGF